DRRLRRRGREVERRVLAQDGALELLQRLPGIEAELGDQRLAGPAIRLECLRLAAAAVEGEHQLPAEPLTQRLACDQHLELADQLRVTAEREVGIDPILHGGGSQILESSRLVRRPPLVGEAPERIPPPEVESFAEHLSGLASVAGGESLPSRP